MYNGQIGPLDECSNVLSVNADEVDVVPPTEIEDFYKDEASSTITDAARGTKTTPLCK